jgi:4-hydroxybenzoate polyprenyltransferase
MTYLGLLVFLGVIWGLAAMVHILPVAIQVLSWWAWPMLFSAIAIIVYLITTREWDPPGDS